MFVQLKSNSFLVQLKEVVVWYSELLANMSKTSPGRLVKEFLDIHFVINDPAKRILNEYPINFLRNVGMKRLTTLL